MSKTLSQLTETLTVDTDDIIWLYDVSADQDKAIKFANIWSKKPYGELYWTANATVTASNGGSAVNVNDDGGSGISSSAGLLNKFTHSASSARLTYTGTEDITVEITAVFSIGLASTAQNVLAQLYKNGASIAKSRQESEAGTTAGSDEQIFTLRCLTTLSTNDYIQTYITVTGVQNCTVSYYHLDVKAL